MTDTDASTARLFFALWPDDLCRERLAREARKLYEFFGGNITRRESIHMTLVFLGDVDQTMMPALQEIGAGIRLRPFTLNMANAGCWTHNRITWIAPAVTPEPLAKLVSDLRREVTQAGLTVEKRPFAPHVTLIRKAHCRPIVTRVTAFEWRVHEFALVRSRLASEGSNYEVLSRWEAASE